MALRPQRVLIIGAAGRDFHNFNVYFRDHSGYEVVAFTAGQLPNIADRRYPAALAGARYPDGIPIEPEAGLSQLVRERAVDVAVFSYSDVSHEDVMHLGSTVLAAGADYLLLGPKHTMLRAAVPVIAVCAVRTGAGKSQTTRRVAGLLRDAGKRVVVVRHPMPYGDLAAQAVQRFATADDLVRHQVTIEEREEYEPLIARGLVVYAGVDYERILREAEREADVIVWDGGNNDMPFYVPDLLIAVVDPHRADHALRYHPGEAVLRMAHVALINKVDTAGLADIEVARGVVVRLAPDATVVEAASPITVDGGEEIRGKRILVIEDGPTLTHGGMRFGAGWIAARRWGAAAVVDPRPYAVGSIRDTFAAWPDTGPVLPAMGYGAAQLHDLEATIRAVPADLVLVASPIDLRRLIALDRPALRVRYELQEIGEPDLRTVLRARGFLAGE
ncbi:MAG TPA: cyclic 2,3-diphosphoglycerate synthase [Gemmatimonadales bacterium]|jgi:predicted GTPase|nr:cyclic 2,3-diphosphoglycerate synthase [Gemmatimonadales bacterium]